MLIRRESGKGYHTPNYGCGTGLHVSATASSADSSHSILYYYAVVFPTLVHQGIYRTILYKEMTFQIILTYTFLALQVAWRFLRRQSGQDITILRNNPLRSSNIPCWLRTVPGGVNRSVV